MTLFKKAVTSMAIHHPLFAIASIGLLTITNLNAETSSNIIDPQQASIRTIPSNDFYDIIIGTGYSQINNSSQYQADTLTSTLQADYYHDNFLVQLSTSYFRSTYVNTTERGMGDTQLGVYIQSAPTEALSFQTGISAIFPTYDSGLNNEATDYQASINTTYFANDIITLFGGYSYTVINDKDIPLVVEYQNTHAYYGGVSFLLNKATWSFSYSDSNSLYTDSDPMRSLNMALYYPINTTWFILGDYKYGLNNTTSDHDISFKLGYNF